MSGITKETFQGLDTDGKLDILFDYLHDIQEASPRRVKDRDIKCAKQVLACNARFVLAENNIKENDKRFRKAAVINAGLVFAGSFIGGWSAVWTAFKFQIFGG